MRRFGALVAKELRQHALPVVGVLLLLFPVVGLMIFGAAINPQNLSYFEALRSALILVGVLLGMVLGNRLVVAEYYGRTQLFLEALPIRRWEPVTVKYLLGLFVMVGTALGLWLVTAGFAATDEPLDARFLVILAVRSLAFIVTLWSFLFMMGFTGRFRMAIYVALLLALAAAGEMTDLEIERFGPLRMVDATMPYERVSLPFLAVVHCVGLTIGFVVTAFALAAIGDGSLAESLAKRMSAREKSAVGAVLMVGFFTYTTVLDERRKPDPYVFPEGTAMVEGRQAPVQIAFVDESSRPAAARLLGLIESDVARLTEQIGWAETPPVRISLRETLDEDTFEPVRLAPGDGVLLRANYAAENVDLLGLRSAVAAALIDAHVDGRAVFEPQRFFLEGYARQLVEANLPDAERATLLRALYATRDSPLEERDFVRWNETRERLGPIVSEGIAAAALRALVAEVGEEKVHALARALYREPVGDDSWVTVKAKLSPFSTVFEESTGISFPAFVAAVGASLEEMRAEPWAAPVRSMPELRAGVEVEAVEGRLRAIEAEVSQPTARVAPTIATLVHHPLEPVDDLLDELEMERDDVAWASGARSASLRLEGRYGPGERAFLAVEVEDETLGCPIRLLAERRTIR